MASIRTAAVVVLVVVAGCSAPVAVGPSDDGPFADPARDPKGWEDGYWAEQPLSVTVGDGLNDSERRAVVARATARVEAVRGVEFRRSVAVEVITRDEFASDPIGSDDGDGDGPSPDRIHRNVRHEALFLVGQHRDSGNATERNDARTVQGYYDVRADRVTIVSPTGTPRIDEGTLAQELFHAYQFRHLVPERVPGPITYDRRRAIVSVVEGDANLVQRRYERRCDRNWTCVVENPGNGGNRSNDGNGTDEGTADGPGIDLGLYVLQYFPYAEGEAYVREVQRREGWGGVTDLYTDLPATTAAVIDGGSAPDPEGVELPRSVGGDWTLVDRAGHDYQTLGESGLASMFAATLYDDREGSPIPPEAVRDGDTSDDRAGLDYRLGATRGWAGDRLYVYRRGDRTAYRWRIAFVDGDAARRFASAYRELLAYYGGQRVGGNRWRIAEGPFADAFSVVRDGATVTIVSAPTDSDLRALRPRE